jgi:fibronectin-binding autotransporter adhesin
LDSSDAVFGSLNGTAGTVTVTTQVTPNSITFSPAGSGNYVISGGSINLLNTTTPINVNTDATISSPFVGSGGLSVAGFGTLTVTGSNTYSGPTLVTGGTLNIAGGGSLNNAMSINTQGGGLLSINSGVVTMASGSTSFGIGCGLNGTTGTTTINSGVLNIGGSNGFTTIGGDFPSAAALSTWGQEVAVDLAVPMPAVSGSMLITPIMAILTLGRAACSTSTAVR